MLMKRNIPNLILTHIASNIVSIILLIIIICLLLFNSPISIKQAENDPYAALQQSIKPVPELSSHLNQNPRMTYITGDILENAKQSNLTLLEDAKEGDILLEYNDLVVVYDADKGKVIAKEILNYISPETAEKITAHPEIKAYSDRNITPQVNVITDELLPAIQQINPNVTEKNIGMYLLAYPGKAYIYDAEKDAFDIIFDIPSAAAQEAGQNPSQGQDSIAFDTNIPNDFFEKLLKHPEMSNISQQQPTGGRITNEAYSKISTAYPAIANTSNIGDFLLQYQDRIIIYDYASDSVKAVLK